MLPPEERIDMKVSRAFKRLVVDGASGEGASMADWIVRRVCGDLGLDPKDYLAEKATPGRKPRAAQAAEEKRRKR